MPVILVLRCNKNIVFVNTLSEEMARVIFLRLDPRSSAQLGPLLMADGHEIHVERESAPIGVVRGSSAVFIGGVAEGYLPVLRRLRALDGKLCLVVIARAPDTQSWLDAIEAGATDYWPAPFEASQVRALIEPATKPRDYPPAAAVFRAGRAAQKPDKAEAMPHS
jgi:DNA-binding NtrC family response regulator